VSLVQDSKGAKEQNSEAHLYEERHHSHQKQQPSINLLITPPRPKATLLPPKHCRASISRMMLVLERPGLLLYMMKPAALMHVLDPPDRARVLIRIELSPLSI